MLWHVAFWYWYYGAGTILFLISWIAFKKVLHALRATEDQEPHVGPGYGPD